MDDVRLQFLLKPQWRNPEGIRKVCDVLQAHGLRSTASGRVTVSARASPAVVQRLFGDVETNPQGPSIDDKRSGALPVPADLETYIENVSVAPRHVQMDSPED
jgi:hypothetical protein